MIGSMGRPARRTGTDRERVTTVTGPADQRPAASETRINTSNTSSGDRAAIESALSQAEACVARMEPSPGTRRLTLALELFRHAVDSWSRLALRRRKSSSCCASTSTRSSTWRKAACRRCLCRDPRDSAVTRLALLEKAVG